MNHKSAITATATSSTRFGLRRSHVGSFLPGLLLAGFLALPVMRCAAQYTSGPQDETTMSMGSFQIQVSPNFTNLFWPTNVATGYFYPGFDPNSCLLTSPVGYGPTQIGESGPHNYLFPNNTAPAFPVTIGVPGAPPQMVGPQDVIAGMSDYYAVPADFAFPSLSNPDEIFTEIESFDLNVNSANLLSCSPDQRVPGPPAGINFDMITAGPYNGTEYGAYPQNVTDQGLRSIGMVQQYLGSDYPGKSFFNIFVNAFLPAVAGTYTDNTFPGSTGNPSPLPPWPTTYTYPFGIAQLFNSEINPLVIENTNVQSLPPEAVYYHGQTTAVPIFFKYNNGSYWNAGDLFGYLTLAGHGVFMCSNSAPNSGTSGLGSNCCSQVTALLDATYGPIGSPLPGMPVPWLRTNGGFPTASTLIHTVNNVVVDAFGNTNDLSDTAQFQISSAVGVLSRVSIGTFSNSVAPPSPHSTATFSNGAVGVTFNVSYNNSAPITYSGTGAVAMTISNTGSASATLYYANPPAQTNYTIQMASLFAHLTSVAGGLFIRADTNASNPSVGEETIQQAPGGYNVSFYDDAHFQVSEDGISWISANKNRALRLVTSMPPPTKVAPTGPGSAALNIVNVNGLVTLFWPAVDSNYILQTTTNLTSPNWVAVTNGTPITGVSIPLGLPAAFYRLVAP